VGFTPDVPGMHGAEAKPADLTRVFSTEGEGCLTRYGVVDFARGVAPGVFAIVTTDNPVTRDLMKYLSMGDGPTYSLYRPYHLTCLETPLTVAEAVLNGSEAIVPLGLEPYAEVSAVAKKDLFPGDFLDEIGEYTHYGCLESRGDHVSGGHVPVGLLDNMVKVLRPIKKGDFIRYEDIDIPATSHKMQLRRLQEEMIERGGLV